MRATLTTFLLLVMSFACSQSRTDSLQSVLSATAVDTQRLGILYSLFEEYQRDSVELAERTIITAIDLARDLNHPRGIVDGINRYAELLRNRSREDTALILINQSLDLALKTDYNLGAADALNAMGALYWQKGDFVRTVAAAERSIALSRELEGKGRMARSLVILGGVHTQKGEYTVAMERYTEASTIFRELGHVRQYAISLDNIGFVQRSLGNNESAIAYFLEADSIHTELGNTSGRAFAAYNLSVVYKNLGLLTQALEFNKRGLELYEKLGFQKRVSYCHYTQGEIYRKQGFPVTARNSYAKALELARSVDDSVNMGYSLVGVAEMELELKNGAAAKTHLREAAGIAGKLNLEILSMDVHRDLSDIFREEGSYREALEHMSRYALLRDSLYTRENRELGTEIEAKYQNTQKEKEIALLASQKNLQALKLQKRENERNAIIGFALIALLLAGLLYNQFRIKQKTNRELKELDRIKSDFFTNITHEFRTPLTLIKAPIDQLEQNPKQGLAPETVRMIRRNTNRVLQLVNQLLDLSRIDKGRMDLILTEGDVYQCLRTTTASFNSHAAQRGIDYQVIIPPGRLWASFDRDKLEKIMYNLLSNAFKFSEDGSVIRITVSFNGSRLEVQVADSGNGIPSESLPFIFDRFYQADPSLTREKEGSGIGLSLSRDLVELMDGTITVKSELNRGSSFTIQVPIQEILTGSPPKEEWKEPYLLPEEMPAVPLNNPDRRALPTILLVEDNPDMCQFIKSQLQATYRVKEARNGRAGWETATNNPPDLVITDLMMPKMDGLELCRKLKADIHTCHIPVLMLTARTGTDNRIEGLETGADDYLSKPFDTRELLVRVRNLILQRQKLRKLFASEGKKIHPEAVTVSSLDERFVRQLMNLLETRHADPDFGIPEMQKILAMSRTQLHRKLKALTGEAPGQLLRNFRLRKAAQLLGQKADTVTQIAYSVGFANLSYFAKCFKELYGIAPSKYAG